MRNCQSFTFPMWPLLVIAGLWISQVVAFCPSQCQCNNHVLETNCMSARLDVIPILFNPALRSLKLSHNRITSIRQVIIILNYIFQRKVFLYYREVKLIP